MCVSGGGYEPEAHYPQWRRIHQPIERRQAFHDSLIKMIEGEYPERQNWTSSVAGLKKKRERERENLYLCKIITPKMVNCRDLARNVEDKEGR